MVSLTSFSSIITKTPPILCSLSTHQNENNHHHHHNNKSSSNRSKNTSSAVPSLSIPSKPKPQKRTINTFTIEPKKPSVAEIERAIGAGVFRDRDIDGESEQSKTLFDTILSNSIGTTEGSVEKKLREAGEWILDRTEGSSSSRSAGKQILKAVFLLILPLWIFSFLVAAGFIKLPFNTPLLDDLIM